MEEEFEKWAGKKARQWVDDLITLQREKGMFMSISNLEYLLIKAFKAGYGYGKNDVEK